MAKGYFITGTDTSVGKTFFTCQIAKFLKTEGNLRIGVMKPIETGCKKGANTLIPEDANLLRNAINSAEDLDLINPYRFGPPLSPHILSRITYIDIEFDKIKECYDTLSIGKDIMFVEGAGGILCPLSEDKFMIDLIKFLDLELIIVAKNKLGSLNQTLLTYKYAKDNGVKIKCIILNNTDEDPKDRSRDHNFIEMIKLRLPIIEELPLIEKGEEVPREKLTLIANYFVG